MHFKSKEIIIEPGKPFEKDLLNRENCAKTLTQLVIAAEDGFTLSIDAEWGFGKTTFIKMLTKLITKYEYDLPY